MILDWQGNEIGCTIDDVVLSGGDKKNFYDDYVSQVGKIVGFREGLFTSVEGINNWPELFNKVEKEFKQQSFLKKAFNDSFAQFFNSFFIYPYGVSCLKGNGHYQFIDELEQADARGETKDNKNELNEKNIGFVRGFNLPILLFLSMQSYKKKSERFNEHAEAFVKIRPQITYCGRDREELEGIIKATLPANFWHNLLSSSDDCIFIYHNPEERIIKFNEYWFASLLHTIHPHIHYLDFTVERGAELRKKFPYHLLRAILFEMDSSRYNLMLEGILGLDLQEIKQITGSSSVEEFIDYSVWNFSRLINTRGGMFYGIHSQALSGKPHCQFESYVKKKYAGKMFPVGRKHELTVLAEGADTLLISNVGQNSQSIFTGEQFSEIYGFANPPMSKKEKKDRVSSFVNLEGRVNGVAADKYFSYAKRKLMRNLGIGAAVIALAMAGSYLVSGKMPSVCDEGRMRGQFTLECKERGEIRPFHFEDLDKLEIEKDDGESLWASAFVGGRSYSFQVVGKENCSKFRRGMDLKDFIEYHKWHPEQCDKIDEEMLRKASDDDQLYINLLSSCTGDMKVVMRVIDTMTEFEKMGMKGRLRDFYKDLLKKVRETKSAGELSLVVQALSDERVLDFCRNYSNRGYYETTAKVIKVLPAIARQRNIEFADNVYELLKTINEANNDETKNLPDLLDDFVSLSKYINGEARTKMVNFATKYARLHKMFRVVSDLNSLVVSYWESTNDPREININEPEYILTIIDALEHWDDVDKMLTVMGAMWDINAKRRNEYGQRGQLRRGKVRLYFAAHVAQMMKFPCVFENYQKLLSEITKRGYSKKTNPSYIDNYYEYLWNIYHTGINLINAKIVEGNPDFPHPPVTRCIFEEDKVDCNFQGGGTRDMFSFLRSYQGKIGKEGYKLFVIEEEESFPYDKGLCEEE